MRLALGAILALLAAPLAAQTPSERPSLVLTRGATNPDITPATMAATICNPHWTTSSIRPMSSFTTKLKKQQMVELGDTVPNALRKIATKSGKGKRPNLAQCIEHSGNPACYEEDHLISLELGGAPKDPNNLWPEPWTGTWNARVKDTLENTLHRLVCAGTVPLEEAQRAIASDWIAAYRQYVGPVPKAP